MRQKLVDTTGPGDFQALGMADGRHLRQGSFAELANDQVVQEAYMGPRA